jgi:hypothetical protein
MLAPVIHLDVLTRAPDAFVIRGLFFILWKRVTDRTFNVCGRSTLRRFQLAQSVL